METQQFNPLHPGEFIKRVYLEPNKIGSNELAAKLHVNESTFSRLVNRKINVSPEMALKLSAVLGRSPESWLLMQDNFNLWQARKSCDLSGLERIQFAA